VLITINFILLMHRYSLLRFQAERSNGARYFRKPGELVRPCSQTLSGNGCDCGFSLREIVVALRMRYLKPRKSLRILRGLITRFRSVTFSLLEILSICMFDWPGEPAVLVYV